MVFCPNLGQVDISKLKLLLFIYGFFLAQAVSGQDRIITTTGDTIFCKIDNLQDRYIIFTLKGNTKDRKRIAFDMVRSYEKGIPAGTAFTKEDEEPFQFAEDPIKKSNNRRGFMLGVGLGYSYRLAKVSSSFPTEIQDYIRKLKSGVTLKVDAAYFFGKHFGIGAKYYLLHAQNRMENVLFELDGGGYQLGELSDNINIHSFQFMVSSRVISKTGRFHFLPSLSAGYSSYHNKAVVLYPLKLTSGTFSMGVHLSFDLSLTDNLFATVGVDYTTGILNYYDTESGSKRDKVSLNGDDRDNLTRVDLWGGLRYYFKSVPKKKKGYYDQ